jgi:hypothetical protein
MCRVSARLDASVVEAQSYGVHLDVGNADARSRFGSGTTSAIWCLLDEPTRAVGDLGCPVVGTRLLEYGAKTFTGGVPPDVRDEAGYYVTAEP